jgi:hypothetical protein
MWGIFFNFDLVELLQAPKVLPSHQLVFCIANQLLGFN